MQVTDELFNKIAELSRLEFTDQEREIVKADLQKMIGFIDKLKEVDTTGVEPLLHMTDNVNILRADNIENMVTREEALKNAPLKDENFFKVPKVIRKPTL
jgi:aspartyl-tRNA(Asn)/glutamyl-tRNA(Gln) amidotransferase subunit C